LEPSNFSILGKVRVMTIKLYDYYIKKKEVTSQVWWLTPVIPAIQEAEMGDSSLRPVQAKS
jgi:hypothetical protein